MPALSASQRRGGGITHSSSCLENTGRGEAEKGGHEGQGVGEPCGDLTAQSWTGGGWAETPMVALGGQGASRRDLGATSWHQPVSLAPLPWPLSLSKSPLLSKQSSSGPCRPLMGPQTAENRGLTSRSTDRVPWGGSRPGVLKSCLTMTSFLQMTL